MRGITRDTFVELVDRKFLWLFGILTVLTCLIIAFTGRADIHIEVQSTGPLGGEAQMENMVSRIMIGVISSFASFLVFISVMATAGLIPRMLEKGRADFYLSKPITRTGLLFNKLLSMWLVYGGLIVVCVAVTSLTALASFGTPGSEVLYIMATSLILLFIWLSIVSFAGVWTASTVMSIVAAFVVYVLQLLLPLREGLYMMISARWLKVILDGLYYIVPKHSQIGGIADTIIKGEVVTTWMPLWSSLIFALVVYSATAVLIKRRDY